MSDMNNLVQHLVKMMFGDDAPEWLAHERRFEHNCNWCVFLGHEEKYDLYYCPQGGIPTVLARYSNDGGDYLSGVPVATTPGFRHCLDVARERAAYLGFPLKADTTVSGYTACFWGPPFPTPPGEYCRDCGPGPCNGSCDESPYFDDWKRRVDDGSIDWAAECNAGNVDIMSGIPLDWWDGGKS